MENIMNNSKKSMTAFCTAWAVALPVMTFAASGVIELEIPGMNPVTAAAISDFTTNPGPATVEAIRSSVASNYDGVVVRKAEKRDELQAEADGLAADLADMIATNASLSAIDRQRRLIEERLSLVDEMTAIVDDMIEFKWYRVEQNVVRFTDSRFGRKHDGDFRYNEPDADGFIPLLGAAGDVCVAYTQVTNAAYALFDPSHAFEAGTEGHPVVDVSYEDAVRYCEWLTDNSPGFAYKYRLPTQEEWELAAGHMPKDAAINAANVESGPTDVYYYFGLYGSGAQSLSGTLDMWGNVWEWLATSDGNGMMKIKGGAFDEDRSQCRTEERGNARDPSQGYHNVGFRILRTKNWAASVFQNAQAADWILRNVEGGASLTAADWRELEKDPDGDGIPTWGEYISLTDPNDANSQFAATIEIAADGTPTIGWNTQTYASRKYTIFGKVNLSDSVWLEVNGNASTYRFFKVAVDLK